MRILVTGAAGFIGFHLVRRLLDMGRSVVGLDNLNDYYSVQLKEDRLAILQENEGLQFIRLDLIEGEEVADLFAAQGVTHVVHLAAQPGVRYSLEAPEIYIQSNVAGLLHILEASRRNDVGHLLFASSSSVYGLNAGTPYNIHQSADHPVSLYGATKKAGEMMAHTYSHIYRLPCTALRFFTVYGPWGRPDMAPFLFTKAILEGRPINVFNHGKMRRSFTYVDDIIEGVIRVIDRIPQPDPEWNGEDPDPSSSSAPYKIYNIGNRSSVELLHFIALLERIIGREAQKNLLPMQRGDVLDNSADVADLERDVDFAPAIPLEQGLARFVEWYRDYYGV